MNIFVLEIWDDEGAKCTYYTVKYDDVDINETDLFFEKHDAMPEYKEANQALLSHIIYAIGNDHGAIDELSNILFNKNEKEIYVLQGIWDMSGWEENSDGETHFSGHKQQLIKYTFSMNKYSKNVLGPTNNFYSVENKTSMQLFKEIINQEKSILKDVNAMNYRIFNQWDGKFEK